MDNYISYEFDSNSIWKNAREKVRSFENPIDIEIHKLSGVTIEKGLMVLNLLKRYNIFPVSIISTDDDSLFISFYTCFKEYNIDVGSEGIEFSIDISHYLKNRNSKGVVECTFDFHECNIDTLKDYLAEIKCDTFEDFEKSIKTIGELPRNWHINYKDSNVISRNIVDNSLKILDFLGNKAIKPYGIFPGVLDMNGTVCIRFCIRIGKRYFLEVQDGGKFLLKKFHIFENKEECKYNFSSIDDFMSGFGDLLTGNSIWCDK